MIPINLPPYPIKTTTKDGRRMIFDFLRRRYVALTPEEWVRQHFVHYLTDHLGYPAALIGNEVTVNVGGVARRCDTVIYNKQGGTPRVIVEYKAPEIKITQQVFTQINAYNSVLRADYLFVSNGLTHLCCKIDYEKGTYDFLPEVPHYEALG